MELNKKKLIEQIQTLNQSLYEETRESLLELKGKAISIPEVKKRLKKELTRDI